MKFQPLKEPSLSRRVYEQLQEAIFSGELNPGEPLRELHLARDLRVSQATIREALVQLEQRGLVVRAPNRGTMVTNMTRAEARERIAVRVLLEGLACAEAARRMTPQDFRELERLAQGIAGALDRNSPSELANTDLAFHRFIWSKAGNATLYRHLDQLTAPLFAFINLLRRGKQVDLRPTVNPHEPIVAALRKGDEEKLRKAIRVHIESSAYDEFVKSDAEDVRTFASAQA